MIETTQLFSILEAGKWATDYIGKKCNHFKYCLFSAVWFSKKSWRKRLNANLTV
ncbi:MAG: hypothetical protein FWF72_07515 [Paludibacter sp.]|nr:hypothetical protein [Paludibacter sp.]